MATIHLYSTGRPNTCTVSWAGAVVVTWRDRSCGPRPIPRSGRYETDRIVTTPELPSAQTLAPSGMLRVAPVAETTHGMPSSRLTMMAWLRAAPTSTTTAAAGTNSGVHEGSVMGAI